MEEIKETSRINYEATKRTVANDRYQEMLRKFRHSENLAFFPFAEFPADQKIKYYEDLLDNRVLTFAANGIWSEDNLDELSGRSISDQERLLFQHMENCWLQLAFNFQTAMENWQFHPTGNNIIGFGEKVALLQSEDIQVLENKVWPDRNKTLDEKRRTRYIIHFANYARAVLDAIFAAALWTPDRGARFFGMIQEYSDNDSPLRNDPSVKLALGRTLPDAIEFAAESLKWKYRVDEEQWIFEDVAKVASQWEEQFKSSKLNDSVLTEKEADNIIRDLTGSGMTRTAKQHIPKLIKRLDDENLAKFDLHRPLIWLCLNNLIQSNHKIELPRQMRHSRSGTRNGSQEYSVQKYIKRWIECGGTASNGTGKQNLTRREAPFSYNKIHFWILAYIAYANTIRMGVGNEYAVSKRLQFKINRQFVGAFRYYEYRTAVRLISKVVRDVYEIFRDYCITGGVIDMPMSADSGKD